MNTIPRYSKSSLAPSLRYTDWLIERLKSAREAAAYLEAVLEEGDQTAVKLALRQIAQAHTAIP